MSQAGANPWDRQFVNLGRIMQFLRDEDSIDNLLTATLDYLRDNFEYKLLWIGLYDAENHRLRVLFVAAQSALEEITIPAANALNRRMWQLLESIEAKRAPRE